MEFPKYLFKCTAFTKDGEETLLTVQIDEEHAESRMIEYLDGTVFHGIISVDGILIVDGYLISLHEITPSGSKATN